MIINDGFLNYYAVDIETKCNLADCGKTECQHGLSPKTSQITCVGVFGWNNKNEEVKMVLRREKHIRDFFMKAECDSYRIVGQYFKFDLDFLYQYNYKFDLGLWVDDTKTMSKHIKTRVTLKYLQDYEKRRHLKNAHLKFREHRKGTPHSLKVLAPFFLGVEPFWENPEDHDNDEYVLKDAEYTARLAALFTLMLKKEKNFDSYRLGFKMERERVKKDLAIVK